MATRDITLKLTDLQIELLRRWIDNAPTNPYAPMIAAVQPQLPLDTDSEACDEYLFNVLHKSAAVPPSADRSPSALSCPRRAEGGVLSDLCRDILIGALPHGESL